MPRCAGGDTPEGGQTAEVEFEDGSVIRLTPNSALSLDNLFRLRVTAFWWKLILLRGMMTYCELRAAAQFRYAVKAGEGVVAG